MYRENVEKMIMDNRKNGNPMLVAVYQALKNEFVKVRTAKNAKELDDTAEVYIIKKMIKERREAADMYKSGNRIDLAENELFEANVLEQMLPVGPSEEDIKQAIEEYIASVEEFSKKHMGPCIKYVKNKLTGVDGKELSALVQTYF